MHCAEILKVKYDSLRNFQDFQLNNLNQTTTLT